MPRNLPKKPGIPFLSGVPTGSRIDIKEKISGVPTGSRIDIKEKIRRIICDSSGNA
jgi:hypothetical protein